MKLWKSGSEVFAIIHTLWDTPIHKPFEVKCSCGCGGEKALSLIQIGPNRYFFEVEWSKTEWLN